METISTSPSCHYLQVVECFGVSPSALLWTHLDWLEQSLKSRCEVWVVRKVTADTRDGFRRGFSVFPMYLHIVVIPVPALIAPLPTFCCPQFVHLRNSFLEFFVLALFVAMSFCLRSRNR